MGSRKLAPRYYSQCQSAATSEVVQSPLSRIVSGAIASELPFTSIYMPLSPSIKNWKGSCRRSGVAAVAVRQDIGSISTYGFTVTRQGDE